MKKNSILICLFLTSVLFSQIVEKPQNFKKINFVYETKSNYHIENQGVYADTLLFKIDFPNLKYIQLNNSSKNEDFNGFIPINNFKEDDLKKLASILYHTNQKFMGEYDKVNDETNFKVIRDDELTKKIFKEILHMKYDYFEYKIKINYKKNKIKTNFPSVSYTHKIDELLNKLTFKNDTIGEYIQIRNHLEFRNIVLLNSKLDPKIMPHEIFSNNNFGIEAIKKINDITILKSVSYSD